MPVFDQYEVELASTYSGSYTDNAIFGDVFVDAATLAAGYTPLGQENPKTSRRLIGSRINGKFATYPNINNMWMPASVIYGYATGSYLGRQQRFEAYYSNEYWYDSYMPNPMDIYQKGNFSPVSIDYYDLNRDSVATLTNELSGSSFGIYSYPENNTVNISFNVVEEPNTKSISYWSAPVPNYVWYKKFPFQSYYKSINRYEAFSTRLPTSYTVNYNFEGTAISPASSSNTLSSIRIVSDLTITRKNFLIVGDYMNTPTATFPYLLKFGTASANNFNKTFFGIGDGTPGLTTRGPCYVATNNIAVAPVTLNNYRLIYAINVRGFKYGIRSIKPEQTKIIYRIGKYGQFRDMLEGRPNTTTLIPSSNDDYTGLPINRTLTYPLEYSFSSSSLIYSQSIDYLTATNPSYNPYDSGTYDIYYRSGQPFFDRPNED